MDIHRLNFYVGNIREQIYKGRSPVVRIGKGMDVSSINMHQIIEKMQKWQVGTIGQQRQCSVFILLVLRENQLHILYEQRASHMKTQPGDICFPGGRMEEGESALDCAFREVFEEIGIAKNQIQLLGQFDTLQEISNLILNTFVGIIDEKVLDDVRLNPDEVEEVFTVPFSFFSDNEPKLYEYEVVQKVEDFPYEEMGIRPDYKWRKGKKSIPIYHYEQYVIWGLTGRITQWFVEKMRG